jgi:hypothetical protein
MQALSGLLPSVCLLCWHSVILLLTHFKKITMSDFHEEDSSIVLLWVTHFYFYLKFKTVKWTMNYSTDVS